ncbi:NTPase [Candidatus Methanocrinis natronophilus]|uniref:Nucleoside-triphosphatase P0O15_04035 n=1 Tax=Candidatus Methanocrinis natronophilus TaxID=3033396 RepID=A0ABT5X6L6_9EURY|nr:NTPase [Candidatus Methanocrinis natronophilus]MDF0590341.1 NTPase [Candidatus Methanocrinis natronophilus]
MPERVAITGPPGLGKSTLVKKVIDLLGRRAGGVLAREVRRGRERTGFILEDLLTGEVGTLASVDRPGPKVGKYRVCLRDLEEVGAGAVERAVREAEVVVIDEVGPMELLSEPFTGAVEAALASDKTMLVVVHAKSSHPLAERIRRELRLFVVTEESRDLLPEEIVSILDPQL